MRHRVTRITVAPRTHPAAPEQARMAVKVGKGVGYVTRSSTVARRLARLHDRRLPRRQAKGAGGRGPRPHVLLRANRAGYLGMLATEPGSESCGGAAAVR